MLLHASPAAKRFALLLLLGDFIPDYTTDSRAAESAERAAASHGAACHAAEHRTGAHTYLLPGGCAAPSECGSERERAGN
jgi:hypothetical protein